jgi:DNA-binding XRE family transcriptional regulator
MPIKMHKWSDVKRRAFSPEQLKKLEAATAQDVLEYNLRELREACGLTQVEMAHRLESVQPSIARVEAGADSKLSTLRKYVGALGGELKIQAVIKGKTVDLAI